ncbi:MAG: hypothetical protein O3A84_03835 [Proteobacteria bacterium]|nr:hypothetical protein [Pseudomonadota bacterium]
MRFQTGAVEGLGGRDIVKLIPVTVELAAKFDQGDILRTGILAAENYGLKGSDGSTGSKTAGFRTGTPL